jgi:hypothetical protein
LQSEPPDNNHSINVPESVHRKLFSSSGVARSFGTQGE